MAPLYWMLIFSMIDRSDEFQLCLFITNFKGFMAFTTGIYGALTGAVRAATAFDALLHCQEAGIPHLSCHLPFGYTGGWATFPWEMFCWFLEVLTVWLAFLLLPFSSDSVVALKRKIQPVNLGERVGAARRKSTLGRAQAAMLAQLRRADSSLDEARSSPGSRA